MDERTPTQFTVTAVVDYAVCGRAFDVAALLLHVMGLLAQSGSKVVPSLTYHRC